MTTAHSNGQDQDRAAVAADLLRDFASAEGLQGRDGIRCPACRDALLDVVERAEGLRVSCTASCTTAEVLGAVSDSTWAAGRQADVGTLALAVAGVGDPDPVDELLRAAREDPGAPFVGGAVAVLAELRSADPARWERVRAELRRAQVRVGALDRRLDDAGGPRGVAATTDTGGQGRALKLREDEPWPSPVNGAELLDDVSAALRRFVALPAGSDVALALWSPHAYVIDAADHTPRLVFGSPTKRCGKTTALEVVAALVPRPVRTENMSLAALFRVVEAAGPTIFLDEADNTLVGRDADRELLGLLNAGHARGGTVVRCVGDDHEPRAFAVFTPVAIGLIGRLPATLADRSIIVPMRRRLPGERVERLRRAEIDGELAPLRRRLRRWTADIANELRRADPDIPSELNDRAADNWRPLFAIADAAGGEWPARARAAAVGVAGGDTDDDAGVLLLGDLRDLFADRGVDRLPTAAIIDALVGLAERPWSEWRRGRPLTPRGLGRLLDPFRVATRNLRMPGGAVLRGLRAEDLAEAIERYLGGSPPIPSATPLRPASEAGERAILSATSGGAVADAIELEPASEAGGSTVADGAGGSGGVDGVARPRRTIR